MINFKQFYEFGEAVYIARSLIGEEYPLSYEDFSMCEPENNQPLKKDNPFVSNSVVYPIPSSGNLTVEFPMFLSQTSRISGKMPCNGFVSSISTLNSLYN